MEKGTLKNTDKEQKQYEQATRELIKMFINLFIAAIATTLFLAGGIYAYYCADKIAGVTFIGASAIAFLAFILLFLNIRRYIIEHNQ